MAACDGRGGPGARVHHLVVQDHGTGLGAEVARLLGVDRATADALVDGHPRSAGADLTIDLAPAQTGIVAIGVSWDDASPCPLPDAVDGVLTRLTRRMLDLEQARTRLHGGAVVDDAGAAVVVLGASGAGKSTLVAHLVAGGRARLVTDEQLTLLPDAGLVGGFTRPVAVKRAGFAHVPAVAGPAIDAVAPDAHVALLDAEALGTRLALAGHPVLVVLPHRDDHHRGHDATWEVLPALTAVEELGANNLDLAARPVAALEAFAWLVSSAPVIRLTYRDAADAVRAIDHLLADLPSAATAPWAVREQAHLDDVASEPGAAVRAAGVLTLSYGDEALLLHTATRGLARLNAAGAALWDSLPWPQVPDEAATRAFLGDLAGKGFVSLEGTDLR